MKVFSKVALIAAAVMLVSVFSGCKTDEAENEASVVAEFNGELRGMKVLEEPVPAGILENVKAQEKTDIEAEVTAYFYDDNTLIVSGFYINYEGDFVRGTYTGDPTKDGKIEVVTKAEFQGGKGIEEYSEAEWRTETVVIENDTFEFQRQPFVFTRVE